MDKISIWPEKHTEKEIGQIGYEPCCQEIRDNTIDQCNSVRLKEKQAEVPTVEWIKSLKKNIEEIGEVKLDLRVLPVLEKLLARPKEKQATPEETIDGFEEASHSADNSTLTFKEKQKGE